MTDKNNEHSASAGSDGSSPVDGIDLRKLADKVYGLMMKDLRLERARGARIAGRRMK